MYFFKLLSYFLLGMSLAMYAAPFDTDINQINNKDKDKDNDTSIGRKRNMNNRTQKRVPKENVYSDKVNSVLQSIHNLPDQSEGLSDFNPLPPPSSVGVEQTRIRDNNESSSSSLDNGSMMSHDPTMQQYQHHNQEPTTEDNSKNPETYYKRFMPNYDTMYKKSPHNLPYYSNNYSSSHPPSSSSSLSPNDILTQKLNYMINLLEERQDERTNNVTEEVVLYSFLGIFIIFIVDSFARVGKYVR